MKELTDKLAQFFKGEDFAEHGDNARLVLTPVELRQILNLMTENARLKTKLDKYNKVFDYIPGDKIMNKLTVCPFCGDVTVRKLDNEVGLWGATCTNCGQHWIEEKRDSDKRPYDFPKLPINTGIGRDLAPINRQ